jgi:hypothetical protein
MAKATLEFNLDDPYDQQAHLRAIKSVDMASFIFQLISNEKKLIMYQLENRDMKDWEAVNMVFERIHELIDEHGINIDELIS